MTDHELPAPVGRGSPLAPPNRFDSIHAEPDYEHFDGDPAFLDELSQAKTEFFEDTARSIVSENDSPDIPFRYSLNPYRGCEHGCAYCYARPTHEYLGLNAGIDFETKIFVKTQAPALLRDFLTRPGWSAETITISGVTDCYQPAEHDWKLTRGCLQVALEARQPVSIITKNALITRDLDLLRPMAELNLVHAFLSITTLDSDLRRALEPRTSAPAARLRAIADLSAAGIPTGVMVAPVIPGLNDSEIPQILTAAREAGAAAAGIVLLRLPLAVGPVFLDWLDRHRPAARAKVEGLVRSLRSGELYQAEFGKRMSGTGPLAESISQTFRVFSRKLGLATSLPAIDRTQFRPPIKHGQLRLF